MRAFLSTAFAGAFLLSASNAAQAKDSGSPRFDVEIDPFAYALDGYSLHLGIFHGRIRYDLGIFGIDVPEMFHGQGDFTQSADGVGLKADYLWRESGGWFTGVSTDITRNEYRHVTSGDAAIRMEGGISARAGYRFVIYRRITITPWVAVGYILFNGEPVRIEGDTFERKGYGIFPTVHFGWLF